MSFFQYYGNNVKNALTFPIEGPSSLHHGFWSTNAAAHSLGDALRRFTKDGNARKKFSEDDQYVGYRRDCLGPPSRFRITFMRVNFLHLDPMTKTNALLSCSSHIES